MNKTNAAVSGGSESPAPRTEALTQGLSARFSRSEIFDTIRVLIRMMDRGSPTQKALLPLLQLIRELPAGRDGTLLDSGDSRILQNVLRAWRERFGGELSTQVRSRLESLERQLGPGEGDGFYLISREPEPEFSLPRFSVEEQRKTSAGMREGPVLILDMELPALGRVRSSLSGGPGGIECLIACDSGTAQRRLRRALPKLRNRLASFPLKELILGRIRKGEGQKGSSADGKGRGIHLWG